MNNRDNQKLANIVGRMANRVEKPENTKTSIVVSPLKDADNAASKSAMGLGYQLLAGMIFFVGGGYYLDSRRGGGHVFTLIGVGLAFIYGGYEVWKLVKSINDADKKQPPVPPKHDKSLRDR